MRIRLIALLLCCALLGGCAADPIARMASPSSSSLPAPVVEDLPTADDQAMLWFRFEDEGLLAPEIRTLTHIRGENLAQPILTELLSGPSAAATELRGLFPRGTKLVSLTQEDGTMFVTLSHHILTPYPDEPADWASDPYWAAEVPLRRQLAMQSIAATLTENCGAQAVVILVAQEKAGEGSLRLQNSYFRTGRTGVAAPIHRDEDLLLTPQRTAEIILQCCQETDWARLYRYVARTDPATGANRPNQDVFTLTMDQLPRLTRFAVAGGSTLGQQAVFTVSGAQLIGGAEAAFTGRILRLTRERGLWRVAFTQLTEGGASR